MAYIGFIAALVLFGISRVIPIDQSHPPTAQIHQQTQLSSSPHALHKHQDKTKPTTHG